MVDTVDIARLPGVRAREATPERPVAGEAEMPAKADAIAQLPGGILSAMGNVTLDDDDCCAGACASSSAMATRRSSSCDTAPCWTTAASKSYSRRRNAFLLLGVCAVAPVSTSAWGVGRPPLASSAGSAPAPASPAPAPDLDAWRCSLANVSHRPMAADLCRIRIPQDRKSVV